MLLAVFVALLSIVLLGINRRFWLQMATVVWFIMPAGHTLLRLWPSMWFQSGGIFCDWKQSVVVRRTLFFRATLCVAGLYLIAALWSPAPMNALKSVVMTLAVLLGVVSICSVCWDQPRILDRTLRALALPLLVQVFTTIAFSLDNSLKAKYYGSSVARAILGATAGEAVAGQASINGLGVSKSAGMLFTNGNRASMVMGATAMLYVSYAFATRRRWPGIIALIAGVGVYETGSKTGLALLVAVPILAILQAMLSNRAAGLNRLIAVPLAFILTGVGIFAVVRFGQSYLARSAYALSPRRALWETAFRAIQDHPLTGWGIGGWEVEWPRIAGKYGISPTFPPHNFLLYAGTQVGIPGMLAQAAALCGVVTFCARGIGSYAEIRVRYALSFAAGSGIWMFIHGQGDNTSFYGTFNMVPVIGLCLALCAMVRGEIPGMASLPTEDGLPCRDEETNNFAAHPKAESGYAGKSIA